MEAVYVVIGGGIAGTSCIDAISLLDENSKTILVSASPYVKAVTQINLLAKLVAEYTVEERSYGDFSSKYRNMDVIFDSVISIDPEQRVVTTSHGRTIKYQKLCICTGASPKLINSNNENVIGIRDTDSVETLQNKLKNAKRLIVVGNGGIATEIIYEISGVDIVWAIKDKHISATFVDAGAAEFFQDRLGKDKDEKPRVEIKTIKYAVNDGGESQLMGAALGPNWHDNITLSNVDRTRTNLIIESEVEVTNIRASEDDDWPIYVDFQNGKSYGCDFIVSATGVVPNSETIRVEGNAFHLSTDKGIKVNSQMETNIANVYAAGDVCTANWTPARHWLQMRLWTQARQMGSYAARCMVESIKDETTIPDFCFELFTHVTRFFGYKVILLGLFNAQTLEKNSYELMLRVTKGQEYIKLVISEGKLQGAILIGDTDLEEMCENLILNQLDVSHLGEDLLNPNVDVEDYFD